MKIELFGKIHMGLEFHNIYIYIYIYILRFDCLKLDFLKIEFQCKTRFLEN